MKTFSFLIVLVICASAAFAAAPPVMEDAGTQVSAPEADGAVCPDGNALPSVGIVPDATPQAPNPCKADCREDYGACLISTPSYICDALYRDCLANC